MPLWEHRCFRAQLSKQMCLRHVSFEVLKKSVRTRLTNTVLCWIFGAGHFLLSIIISFFDLVAGWNIRAPSINEFGFFWNGGQDFCWENVQCQSTSLKKCIFHREWDWLGRYYESKAHVNPDCPVRRFRRGKLLSRTRCPRRSQESNLNKVTLAPTRTQQRFISRSVAMPCLNLFMVTNVSAALCVWDQPELSAHISLLKCLKHERNTLFA